MKGPWLLDVNVLLGWLWPAHQTHSMALAWMKNLGSEQWATCPITQMGFLRIVANPSFSPAAPAWAEANALLRKHIANSPTHVFWEDNLGLDEVDRRLGKRIQGPGQITDAYLLSLAIHRKGRLVTFDYRATTLAPLGTPEHTSLHILRI